MFLVRNYTEWTLIFDERKRYMVDHMGFKDFQTDINGGLGEISF